ncbi:MAG: family 78 glycoside hydrolase catalytic domain [Chloroflexi bacterium]|nr:family 78 glycoside hydrolase catalytic domain [Chloroflexota bacterium]
MSTELRVTDLRCEARVNPLGIDAPKPRLSWKLVSDARDVLQASYRVQAASDPDFTQLLWDSGTVACRRSVLVPWEGLALASRAKVWWRVQVTDTAGRSSGWSETAWFELGLLEPGDWCSQWIASQPPDNVDQKQSCPMLRTSFTLECAVRSARLYASALGLYELWINGVRVGQDLLTPGWTAYQARVQYQTYDVTSLLQPGANALGGLLGRGWYAGYFGLGDNQNNYGNLPALIAQLEITCDDGSVVRIVTDESWRTAASPILMSEFYLGETYDARLEQPDWAMPGADLSGWGRVYAVPYAGQLIAQANLPIRAQETITPIEVIKTPAGETVIDFGQNMVGWVRFSVNAPAGSLVKYDHAEVLDAAGNFYIENMRAATNMITYTCRGGGRETYEPRFTHQGWRYIRLLEWPGEPNLADFAGIVVHSDMPVTGSFACANELVNQLQHNILWGQKGNFVDVPTDCPQRDERLGWTGDAQVFARTACFNMDTQLFFAKWLADLAIDQAPNGAVPNVVPDVLKNIFGPPASACGWSDAAVIIPWTTYLCYGDTAILEAQYPSMQAHVRHIRSIAEDEVLWNSGAHFGDWLALDAKEGSYFGATPNDFSATAYYAYSVELLAKIAAILGKHEDAEELRHLHGRIVTAFRNEFITPSGRLAVPTQSAHVLVLAFNLMEEKDRARVAGTLVKMLEQNNWHLTTGFLGTPYLCRVLSENGRSDVAWKLVLQQDFPSWLYQITMGATTIWEHWDGIRPDGSFWSANMNSFNHYSYGSIGDWLYRYAVGLETSESQPAYQHTIIRPQPNQAMRWAEASHETPYGMLSCRWEHGDGTMTVDLVIPPNTTSELWLTGARIETLREGGVQPKARQDSDGAALSLGSGTYRFTYPLAEGALPDVPADLPKQPGQ